jgi:hypothetical protein
VPKQRLAAIRAKGLRLVASCNEACTVKVQLFLGKRVLGTVSGKLAAGKKALRLKLTAKGKRSLAYRHGARLKLRASATDGIGNVGHSSRSLRIRR